MRKTGLLLLTMVLTAGLFLGCLSGNAGASSQSTLTYALSGDIDNFDPYTNQSLTFIKSIGYNCYESLLHIGADMEYVFDLAESVEHPDDMTYIFKLRSGVKFHDGSDMTAEDVKFSFERTQDKDLGAWQGVFFTCVDSIDIVDANTVQFNLGTFSNTFLDNCVMVKIIKQGTENGLKQAPIGTGPFKFVKWSPNDNISLEKFADYWDAHNVKLEKLIFKPIPDKSIQLANLSSGAVNLVEDLPLAEIDRINSDPGLQLLQPKTSTATVLFEVGRHNFAPFADPRVMEVMAMAFDKETINKSVYKGLANVIWSQYPSGFKFYKDIKGPGFDLEAAKAKLAETPYADGFEFTVWLLAGYTEWENLSVIYQADLAKIGIKMNIRIGELSEWLDHYLNRTYEMICNGGPMAGTDPAVYDGIILSQLYPYQMADLTELQDLLNSARMEADQEKRAEMYGQIQDLVYEYKPVMSIVETPVLCGASANLKGVVVNPVAHTFLKEAYFE